MRRFNILALFFLLLVGSAFGNTVTMNFLGPGGPNGGGVYTYPYNFSINGSSSPTSLICDSFDNHVFAGETWTANVSSLLSGQGLFGGALLDYKAAGLIFKSILAGGTSEVAGNWAIWGLFSSNAQNNSFYQSSGANAIAAQFLALAANAPNSSFKGLVLYTPLRGNSSVDGLPQEYIGYNPTPEPATMTLFGSGLASLGLLRRKRAGKTAPQQA